jgi:hypothetical protein
MIKLLLVCLSLQILLPSTFSTFHHFSRPLHARLWVFALLNATTQTFKLKPKDHLLFSSYLSVRLLSSSYKNESFRCKKFSKGEVERLM